jgi:hypothetical protein
MKNLTRAQRKKAMKSFKVGDVVTWGHGITAHQVVEVCQKGVVVDVTSCDDDPLIGCWARKQPDGRYFVTVLYDGNTQCTGIRCRFRKLGIDAGPPRHSDLEPDKRV